MVKTKSKDLESRHGMHTTSVSLLQRLREPGQQQAWERFVSLYTPLLLYWARRTGVPTQDAADLVQEVFAHLVRKLPEFTYDQRKSFRSWLRTVALNQWRDYQRRRSTAPTPGAEGLSGVISPEGLEQLWETEHQEHLLRRALEIMQTEFQPTTWQACWEHVVGGRAAAEVAKDLGISENAVYIAKCRVIRRLRQELEGLLD